MGIFVAECTKSKLLLKISKGRRNIIYWAHHTSTAETGESHTHTHWATELQPKRTEIENQSSDRNICAAHRAHLHQFPVPGRCNLKTQITEPFDPNLFVRTSTLFPLRGGRGEWVGGIWQVSLDPATVSLNFIGFIGWWMPALIPFSNIKSYCAATQASVCDPLRPPNTPLIDILCSEVCMLPFMCYFWKQRHCSCNSAVNLPGYVCVYVCGGGEDAWNLLTGNQPGQSITLGAWSQGHTHRRGRVWQWLSKPQSLLRLHRLSVALEPDADQPLAINPFTLTPASIWVVVLPGFSECSLD